MSRGGRSHEVFIEERKIMKVSRLAAAVAVIAVIVGSGVWARTDGRTISLTAGDDMKYSVTTIQAKPGESLHIVLKSVGAMPKMAAAHNFVVLKAGTKVDAFLTAAMSAGATGYIPAEFKAQILAQTGLAGPGETVEVTFTAPKVAGTYQYLCTFPGHFASGMKGTLVVK
jgi:azurin